MPGRLSNGLSSSPAARRRRPPLRPLRARRLDDLPDPVVNIASLGEDAFARHGDYPGLWFEGRWHRTADLRGAAHAAATGLRGLGVEPGDRVVVTMTNCPEVGIAYSAVWHAGAVVVPVLFLLTAVELRHIVEDCTPVAVIATAELVDKVREATTGTAVRHLIVAGGSGDGSVDFASLC